MVDGAVERGHPEERVTLRLSPLARLIDDRPELTIPLRQRQVGDHVAVEHAAVVQVEAGLEGADVFEQVRWLRRPEGLDDLGVQAVHVAWSRAEGTSLTLPVV